MRRNRRATPKVAPGRVSALLILLSLLLWWTGPVFAQSAFLSGPAVRNYLRNSTFDSAEFWILKGEGTRFDPAAGLTGGGVVMEGASAQSELVQTIGPLLEPGLYYTVSVRVKALSKQATAVVGVRWEGGHPRVFRGINPEDGWVRIDLRFEAPRTPGWRQVVVTGSGDLVWDEIYLHEADTLEARLAREWEERIRNGESIYTGLVVNALGTPLERGMNPRIFDEDGQLVFAGISADDSQLFSHGLVAYARDLQEGSAHPRLRVSEAFPFRLPLVVDAQGTQGMPRVDVVIGRADAARIREAVAEYDFLGRFAIVFVVEPSFPNLQGL